MGIVFRARDLRNDVVVAVKVMPGSGQDHGQRFLREGEILAKLRHSAVVRHVDHGVDDDGTHYLVTEWLEGRSLSARLQEGPLPVGEALALTHRMSRALAAVHALGLVHRDVKPSNIMLVEDRIERAKLLDFGVARSGGPGPALTASGMLLGSPGYLAPEQARSARRVDARADVFGLGCVLFKCLTGRLPFAGDTIHTTLAQTLFAPIPLPSEHRAGLPASVDDLVVRMLAKNPADRIADGSALMPEVERVISRLGGVGSSTSFEVRAHRLEESEHRLVAVIQVGAMWDEETTPGAEDGVLGRGGPEDTSVAGLAARFGGACELMVTGEAIITFSGDRAATDLARRAARCALAIRTRAPNTTISLVMGSAELDVPVATVMSDVFCRADELAKRIPACDGVRIDASVESLVSGRFLVRHDEGGPWLREERAGFDEASLLMGKRTPFVGREPEMAMLDAVFRQGLESGCARAVLVTGDPGMGKSRVRKEFLAKHASHESVRTWLGVADPTGGCAPLAPVARALRGQVGLFGSEPGGAARARLRAWLAPLIPADELDRVALFAGELLNVPAAEPVPQPLDAARHDPRLMGDQLRRALLDILDGACRRYALVLAVEDLHAADEATVELLDDALGKLRDRPLLVLAFARTEVAERFPALWRRRGLSQIHLASLPSTAARQLVDVVVDKEMPASRREEIVTRSGGNPFFLEELIRRADDADDPAPLSLVAMTQARLEGLVPEARRILRAASVFGGRFRAQGVAAVLGQMKAEDVAGWLHNLAETEVVDELPEPSFSGESAYAFRHALVREAAYAMLTDRDRTRAHLAAARWLTSIGEPDATVVAEHWQRAQRAEEAASAFARAAEQAKESGAFAAAVALARRGLQVATQSRVKGRLWALEAQLHAWLGELDKARDSAQRALAGLSPSDEAWVTAAGVLAEALARLGSAGPAADALERLVGARVPSEHEADRVAHGYTALGSLIATCDAPVDRLRPCQRQLDERATAIEVPSPSMAAARCRALAWWSLLVADNPEDYLLWSLEGVRLAEAAGDGRRLVEACHDAGFAHVMVGDPVSAEGVLIRGIQQARALGFAHAGAVCRHNLGLALLRQGRLEEALDAENEALRDFEAQGSPRFVTGCQLYVSQIHQAAGRLQHAFDAADSATRRAAAGSDLYGLALVQRARVELAQHRVVEACATLREMEAVFATLGPVQEEGEEIRLVRAEALLAVGRVDEAHVLLAEARDRVTARAARIRDPRVRGRYTCQVPANARVLELTGAKT